MRWAYPRGVHALLHRYGTRFARPRPAPVTPRLETPTTVEAAVSALGAKNAAPLGGGTDLVPLADQAIRRPAVLVDLLRVPEMRRIDGEEVGGGLRIGGAVTLADLLRDERTARYPALREALGTIATPQIREMATVAGNLCQTKRCWFFRNGFECYKRGGASCPCYAVLGDSRFYHAVVDAHRCQAVTPSDLGTVLTALDATLHVTGRSGARTMPIAKLYRGPGETTLAADDVITQISLPAPAARRSHFEKIRLWEGDFAVVSVAIDLDVTGGVVSDARVVLGATAPTPLRVRAAEEALEGRTLDDETIAHASTAWAESAHPLPRNEWKVDAACGLLARALEAMR
jgi:CO/xanthine dehydrogenase FAD-binding subunit